MKLLHLTVYGVLLALLLAACSGDEVEAPGLTFRASSDVINEGESSSLSWDVRGSEPVTLTLEPPLPAEVALTSPLEVSPTETTTYTLTATNNAGSQSREVTVEVNKLPEVMRFELSSESVVQGRSITVSWETSSDDPVIATLTPSDTPDEPVTSPLTLSPTETTTYTLTLTNSAGSTNREFTVTVNPPAAPTIDGFASTPTMGNGLEVMFNWNLSSASECSLDPGDGSPALTFDDCMTTTDVSHSYTQAGDYSVTFSLPTGATQTLNITVSTTDTPPNTPPTVNLGDDISTIINTPTTLIGQVSDADGDELTLTWEIVSQPAGSNATLEDITTNPEPTVILTPDVEGEYIVKLTATDGSSISSDSVTITATSTTPTNTVYFLQDTNPTNLTEGQTQIITLERTGTTVSPLTVYLQLAAGTTATADDYSITGATLEGDTYEVIFEEQRSRTEFTLAAINDDLEETDEQVVFTLLPNDTYTQGQPANITIRLNDEVDTPDEPGEPNPDLRFCDGFFTVNSQEQLDTFKNCEGVRRLIVNQASPNGAGLEDVEGNSPITSLAPLSHLQQAILPLEIINTEVTSLAGLENFSQGALRIHNNDLLQSLTGLDSYQGPSLTITDNDLLTSLQGFPSQFDQAILVIGNSSALESLEGINNLTELQRLFIVDNPVLTSLAALSQVTTIGDGLTISNNDSLTTLDGLQNAAFTGTLTIQDNDALTSLATLNDVTSLVNLTITDNRALGTLAGLNNLTQLVNYTNRTTNSRELPIPQWGNATIRNNDALTSLVGLDKLTEIEGRLTIADNDALVSLDGLNALTNIGQTLSITGNSVLTSLQALSQLTNDAIGDVVTISSNAQLDCPAQNLAFVPDESTGNAVNCVLRQELFPNITTFTATPEVISEGGSSTLAWEVIGPEPITVSIADVVEGASATGNASVSPVQTTTYTLTASNIYGQVSDVVTVIVDGATLEVCRGDYTVTTQAELDDLARCSQIEGDLLIRQRPNQPREIGSLQPLINVQRINGDLTIGGVSFPGNPYIGVDMTNLAGLDNLKAVDGDVIIMDNNNLITLEGLNSLEIIGGSLILGEWFELGLDSRPIGNTSLISLEGLNSLRSVGGHIQLYYNYAVTSIKALSNLTSAQGVLLLDVTALRTLEGLENITSLQEFQLFDSPDVTNLEGLPNTSALISLSIGGNEALTSLEGIGDLSSLTNLSVISNPALVSLEGIGNVPSLKSLYLNSNRNLLTLGDLVAPASLEILTIYDNLTSLEGMENVKSIKVARFSLGDRTTSLSPMSNVAVTNSLDISSSGLTSLEGLEGTTSLYDVRIRGNSQLTSLQGLNNLRTISRTDNALGAIDISDNPSLTSLSGLDSLERVRGVMGLRENNSLTSLQGLGSLISVRTLTMSQHDALTSLAGLDSMVNALSIEINDAPALTSLTGLEGLTTASTIHVTNAPLLNTLQGLGNLTSVGILQLETTGLASLMPLENVSVNTGLIIRESQLTSFAGLEESRELRGPLLIENNSQLTSLAGLENVSLLDSIWADTTPPGLYIIGNPLLTTLNELASLKTIRANITISNNPNLASIAVLGNIEGYRDVRQVTISRNPSLDCSSSPDLPFIVDVSTGNAVNCPTP